MNIDIIDLLMGFGVIALLMEFPLITIIILICISNKIDNKEN